MVKIEIPFRAGDTYGSISLEHGELTEEQAVAVLRGMVNFEQLEGVIMEYKNG